MNICNTVHPNSFCDSGREQNKSHNIPRPSKTRKSQDPTSSQQQHSKTEWFYGTPGQPELPKLTREQDHEVEAVQKAGLFEKIGNVDYFRKSCCW